jgi:hypothetical protein
VKTKIGVVSELQKFRINELKKKGFNAIVVNDLADLTFLKYI